jgi:two-component system, OmpR family, sensor histidine kinase ArlS
MKIRTKFIFNYSILSVILLLLFSIIVVLSYIKYRHHNFNIRLHNRAVSSANLLFNENTIDSTMLRLIDSNIITAMDDLEITIYNQTHKILYTNLPPTEALVKNVREKYKSTLSELFGLGYNKISFTYTKRNQKYLIVASAFDSYGLSELKSLLMILLSVLILSIIVIAGFGFYNAVWSLKPFKKIVEEVEGIDPSLVKTRVSVNSSDEISQLAKAFNTLLDRIEQAFETEKSFISNASHELRTPVTSVLGQIEVALNKTRQEGEYKEILKSVYEDTAQMATIINGFLNLAETNLTKSQMVMEKVRIDELIFAVVDDFEKQKPYYNISVDFHTNPEADTQLECIGNERMLRLMFSNLIDNACKYSSDHKAKVTIDLSIVSIMVTISDKGIGIPYEDLKDIYKPLFRSHNTSGKQGHGLGLAIVKRIADLHNTDIIINSEINIGTSVIVYIRTNTIPNEAKI